MNQDTGYQVLTKARACKNLQLAYIFKSKNKLII